MKYFSYTLLILLFFACNNTEESPECQNEKYDKEFTVTLGETVCFPDGNSFEVKTITDQFCCCFCNCFWAGQLEVMVETTDTDGQKDLFTFGSNTYIDFNKIFNGYTISEFDYLYDGEPNSLPLCEGQYDANKTEISLRITAE